MSVPIHCFSSSSVAFFFWTDKNEKMRRRRRKGETKATARMHVRIHLKKYRKKIFSHQFSNIDVMHLDVSKRMNK